MSLTAPGYHPGRSIRNGLRLACVAAGLLLTTPASPLLAQAVDEPQQLIKANYKTITDSRGQSWSLSSNSQLNTGSNIFNNAFQLKEGDNYFRPMLQLMNPAGDVYYFTGNIGEWWIRRRIHLDGNNARVVYLESIHNPSPRDRQLVLTLYTQMRQKVSTVTTSQGQLYGDELDEEDIGIVFTPNKGPSLQHILCSTSYQPKPEIMVGSQRYITVNYHATVKAGETAHFLHIVAQQPEPSSSSKRELITPEDRGAQLREMLPAQVRDLLPRYARSGILNFQGGGPSSFAVKLPASPIEELYLRESLMEDKGDYLRLDQKVHLYGQLEGSVVRLKSALGEAFFQLDEIAAIEGPLSTGSGCRLYLLSGEVYHGEVSLEGLNFKSETNISIALEADKLHTLIPKRELSEEGGYTLLGDASGDIVALAEGQEALAVRMSGPLGTHELPLSNLVYLGYQEVPYAHHRAFLADSSFIPVQPHGEPITVKTLRFGEWLVDPVSLRSFRGGIPAGSARIEVQEPFAGPIVQLSDGFWITGKIENEQFSVGNEIGLHTLPTEAISSVSRIHQEEEEGDLFEFAQRGANTVTGTPGEEWIRVRNHLYQWTIPMPLVEGIRFPEPLPEEEIIDPLEPSETETPEAEAEPEGNA